MNEFKLEAHRDLSVTVGEIGEEKQPIILVENFINDADNFVAHTANKAKFNESKDYYPGIRTQSPDSYMTLVRDVLGQLICDTFKLRPEKISHSQSYLSIVSTPPDKLKPFQSIPHFDGTSPEDIAFLHYLCDDRFGGTSFYRHNKTGYEYVNQLRLEKYIKTVNEETSKSGIEKKYLFGDSKLFTRIDSIEAKFNRLIIYRGTSLHSGDIRENYKFDTNPLTGRLTVTSFLYSVI